MAIATCVLENAFMNLSIDEFGGHGIAISLRRLEMDSHRTARCIEVLEDVR